LGTNRLPPGAVNSHQSLRSGSSHGQPSHGSTAASRGAARWTGSSQARADPPLRTTCNVALWMGPVVVCGSVGWIGANDAVWLCGWIPYLAVLAVGLISAWIERWPSAHTEASTDSSTWLGFGFGFGSGSGLGLGLGDEHLVRVEAEHDLVQGARDGVGAARMGGEHDGQQPRTQRLILRGVGPCVRWQAERALCERLGFGFGFGFGFEFGFGVWVGVGVTLGEREHRACSLDRHAVA
jgi:hypothetical protein